MKTLQGKQTFFVYDGKMNRLGIKSREVIHRNGDWHRVVQLNLYNNGDLLLQRRGWNVDIAYGSLDQSLATHLLVTDKENEMNALKRGLWEELGIDTTTLDIRKLAGPKKIIKRYNYDPTLFNREFVTLYEANLSNRSVVPRSPRVAEVFWMSAKQVRVFALKRPELFTQTFVMWLKEVM